MYPTKLILPAFYCGKPIRLLDVMNLSKIFNKSLGNGCQILLLILDDEFKRIN